jgi:sorbitol/mannitol transport system substrate-binding protein
MPDQPTYDQIGEFAAKLTDKSKEQYGVCLRGKPGWGENMAFIGTLVNTFGGRWFDMDWKPQLDTEPWKNALTFYVDLMNKYGPPGASGNGYNENQALFQTGKCAMWIDATSAAGRVFDPKQSSVADVTGFTTAPTQVTPNGSSWFWAWSLGVPTTSTKLDVAKSFLKWSTSKAYVKLVGESEGWVAIPPGTRASTYALAEYQKAAPFAQTVLKAIQGADPSHPTKDPVPYTGIQYVSIPEFQGIGTAVGQQFAAALTGQVTVDQALQSSQQLTTREMTKAGYIK